MDSNDGGIDELERDQRNTDFDQGDFPDSRVEEEAEPSHDEF